MWFHDALLLCQFWWISLVFVQKAKLFHTWVISDIRSVVLKWDWHMMVRIFSGPISRQLIVLFFHVKRVRTKSFCFQQLDLTLLQWDICKFEVLGFNVQHLRWELFDNSSLAVLAGRHESTNLTSAYLRTDLGKLIRVPAYFLKKLLLYFYLYSLVK